jgi:O-succinylbenzoic acid--CoA ligase
VSALEHVSVTRGDLVAVSLEPGPAWLDLVADTWAAGAALLPIDHRLPAREAGGLLERARPTVSLDAAGARRIDGEAAAPEIALIVHTSGTGGAPKFVQFDRRAIDAAVACSASALGASDADRWLCCLPLAHVGGLLVLLRAVLLGAPVTIHPGFDAVAVAAERGSAFTSLVPTMLGRLIAAGAELSGFRAILVGGAHLSPDLRASAEHASASVIETYGLTETCGGVVYDGVPLPGTEMRIDPEGGIELRGPTLMRGYRFDPSATAAAFTEDGWLRAGDAGEIDGEGRLHVVGRFDDQINTGGEKVWPDEVEAALREHPGVRDVAAGGRPDPEWGQRVAVWVVPADPSDPPSLDELRAFVALTLPRHAAPRELTLAERLPRTASGKLRRAALPRD